MKDQFFLTSDSIQLRVRIVDSNSPVWLIVTHGIAEHLGRHEYLSELFGQDFNILFYDLRGHGKSCGRRVYVESFAHYYRDLEEIILMLKEKYSMGRFALFGHSMGATITCGYIQNQASRTLCPEKVFLCSPAIGITGNLRPLVEYLPTSIFKWAASCPISVETGKLVDIRNLSHNSKVCDDYCSDKLNSLQIHTKLILELAIAMKTVFSRSLRFKGLGYCAYGTGDKIACPDATKNYFQKFEHRMELQSYNGAYHELHNETPGYRKDYFDFLKKSLGQFLN